MVRLDDSWQPVKESEERVSCDTVCLAVGLTPSTRLISQLGVHMETVPEAGGYIAIHDETMQTSVPRVFVAGDSSGIEEASTAMIEGKIAGAAAARSLRYEKRRAAENIQRFSSELTRLRAGPFGEKPRLAKKRIDSFWRRRDESI